ncbi:magnesium transport protein CorA [Actinoplanes ianthinogenes]|uniref:Magnesium transport protein CorA n=1 Tax=Actinoplanes ianthinogenes TaxID=122358 RepID=A0ABM7LNS3_9ACTN|nr:magnesium transporter CorA family protein [Actinoplanes ianthinogenes]BCJ40919.1 magnesium transport protein CorA [Actinoplanes ianthinogenes]GGR24226.1 magnesium transport protein CorA [Actinoplanes ianthinogenes]
MDVWLITDEGLAEQEPDRLPALLSGGHGVIWVDIPSCDERAMGVLKEVFGFHPQAVRDSAERNRVPKVHVYRDHAFVVLHAPELGAAGHVHYVELDQFIGPNYLVTVHGPLNPAVDPRAAQRETHEVLRRVRAGRLLPVSGWELSYAVVAALARHLEGFIEHQTEAVWQLEQRVTSGHLGNPEQFLDEMFRTRHGLIAVRTMGALGREIYGRLATIHRAVPPEATPLLDDIVDQFARVHGVADSQKEYLQGVIEFYRTRSDTKMTVAAERLAVIAVVTLPITALSSVLGMNLIVNQHSDFSLLGATLIVMLVMSALLLTWAKRQGWW